MTRIEPMPEKLFNYLEQNLAGFRGPAHLEEFTGGQSNPSYKLTAKSGVYVIRRQPYGKLLESAHAVDREYWVLASLAGSLHPARTSERALVAAKQYDRMGYTDHAIRRARYA